ncbi:MAG: DUF692 domain-containing protein [Sulfuricurvum sp.]
MRGISGCGLGLRRDFIREFALTHERPDWIEITPENWFFTPHRHREHFEQIMSEYNTVAHGVSLSIGSPEPVDKSFLKQMKAFLDRYGIEHYSEHVSFSTLQGKQTYELLPLPMTREMIRHLCEKIDQVQNTLERPLVLENASYYISPYSEMREVDFLCEVLEQSNTRLLLDVNNVYVNATNHRFDADAYIAHIPRKRVAYMHIAGHLEYPDEELLLDTHGEPICDNVWSLLERTLQTHKAPVMIERDNNIPPLEELMEEFRTLKRIMGEA